LQWAVKRGKVDKRVTRPKNEFVIFKTEFISLTEFLFFFHFHLFSRQLKSQILLQNPSFWIWIYIKKLICFRLSLALCFESFQRRRNRKCELNGFSGRLRGKEKKINWRFGQIITRGFVCWWWVLFQGDLDGREDGQTRALVELFCCCWFLNL
jgi:hypothetical protein